EKYLQPGDRFITCIFGSIEKGKAVQKGVYAKMARGQMVRYMASHHIEDPGALMDFGESGYRYDLSRSDENTYVFIRQ
ncbi:MAG: peroxide stress protein YaaA, partial [Lachnospiraceae bacterium]|nr:peroxide stress protein YaaA [Lachnospiraceae bacterium]